MHTFTRKVKWPFMFTAIGLTFGIVAVACAQPTASTVEGLFKPSSAFADRTDFSLSSILQKSLINRESFNQYLAMRLAPVLRTFYEDNYDTDIKERLNGFTADTDNAFVSQEQNLRNQFRENYLVHLQTDIFDNTGGNQAAWKLRDVNNKIIDDFISRIFAKNFVEYVQDGVGPLTKPTKSLIENTSNFKNIKLQPKFVNKNAKLKINNDAVYAAIQDKLLDQFITNENPNLVSRVVFTNETPVDGFDNYFNTKVIQSPTPSYQFQVFNKYNQQSGGTKGANGFNLLASNLKSYKNDQSKGIDIPNKFSSDSGGKLLLKASDMFDTFDPSFSAAFIQGYLALQKKSKGADSKEVDSLIKDKSIIENFFVDNNTQAAAAARAASSSSEGTIQLKTASDGGGTTQSTVHKTDLVKIFGDKDVFAGEYKQQIGNTNANQTGGGGSGGGGGTSTGSSTGSSTETTTGNSSKAVVDLIEVKKDSSSQPDYILSRGKDGIHLMAVDGGSHYLTESGRDVAKQKKFLLFRALQTKYGLVDTDTTYDFKLFDEVKKYFDTNRILFLFEALLDLSSDTNNKDNFLSYPQFKKFADSIKSIEKDLKELVQAHYKQAVFNETAVAENKVTLKLAERNQPFIDNERNNQIEQNGLAAKLPYEQDAKTGHYNDLGNYYKDIIDNVDKKGTSTVKTTSSNTGQTKNFSEEVVSKLKDNKKKVEEAAKKHVEALKVFTIPSPLYSQVILVQTKLSFTPESTSLGLNLALNNYLTSTELQNSIKLSYFQEDEAFKKIIDITNLTFSQQSGGTGGTNGNNNLTADNWKIFKETYLLDLFESQAQKSIFGHVGSSDKNSSTKTGIEGVLDTLYSSLNLEERLDSDDVIDYLSYLYTAHWLLKDNLKNYKQSLQSKLSRTSNAFLVWSVDSEKNKNDSQSTLSSTASSTSNTGLIQLRSVVSLAQNQAAGQGGDNNSDITQTEVKNPNFVFGSSVYDWTNSKTPEVNRAADDTSSFFYTKSSSSSTGAAQSSATVLRSLNQASGMTTKTAKNRYGFRGIVTSSTSGSLPEAVSRRLFKQFVNQTEKGVKVGGQMLITTAKSGKATLVLKQQADDAESTTNNAYKGALFSFGSMDNLKNIINGIQTQTEFDALYNHLTSYLNIDVTGVDKNKTLTEQKTSLTSFVDSNFKQSTQSAQRGDTSARSARSATVQIKKTQEDNQNTNYKDVFSRFDGYIGDNKVEEKNYTSYQFLSDGGKYHATFVKQVNLDDVEKIGTDSLKQEDSSKDKRLNLSLEEFLAAIALEALDPNNQTQAINALISGNKKGLVKVGDFRIFSSISAQWVRRF
ncbi:DUF3713 domain-containing protein [Mycoplasmoides pneumoniae]|uniref:DUF3713 domain-containing protein n=1 Tax=Mycoplasmoides pneumoniae TaxID=2104 RepID=UPI00047543B7|nr:DUF3713 domain-containing protein [Mycoplasmoides pneumoniae]ALA30321.1 hypothetical protein C897_02520 [Mycoplasmoides pneumoniae PI 1428]ALA32426.1 hypothetical protein F533_02515 [Mycoplasmoides pneumoniae 51494]ALA33127.1 hypothetical protein F530_02520 [Mycoplasmoides pneumoniae 54089]ALA33832.1 hypothetical protein F531_02520 [Mycoplasmoides pneumoniae 54524]ARQ36017.1 hypothetical protein BIX64_02535 [Mycoplasmoides pneumoniae]